ncbi:Transcriptional regulator ATRX-like [Papilio machaon]|uniref:Transcriptional regulator ATRX-like n=1 Tax=Papilio machaon TaxID=76193 RepID=A0A0N1PJW3_PAPMA|nr:Transcriptional regulator ATRX-like [Papilio machaon]
MSMGSGRFAISANSCGRLLGTMEEKIYERQVTKQAISKRVIDEQQIDRHYAENDLAELYKFLPRPPAPRPLPPLPKDRLFAELLREHDAQVHKQTNKYNYSLKQGEELSFADFFAILIAVCSFLFLTDSNIVCSFKYFFLFA